VIVVDTNVVSELMRPEPAPAVVAWLRRQLETPLVSAITVAEVRYGLARLPGGRRADSLRRIADEVLAAFPDEIVAFDADAATRYGALVAARESSGRPISALDAQIAAICLAHEATLATRNTKDFSDTGVELVDPWAG
jgi:toxin FitB